METRLAQNFQLLRASPSFCACRMASSYGYIYLYVYSHSHWSLHAMPYIGLVASTVDLVTTLRLLLDLCLGTLTLTPHAHAHTHNTTHTITTTTYKKHTQQAGTLLVWQDWQDLTGFMQRRKTHKGIYIHAQQAGTIT